MACITSLLECDMTEMPKEHLEQAKDLFAWIIQEHMNSLGEPLPHQQADTIQTHPQALKRFPCILMY